MATNLIKEIAHKANAARAYANEALLAGDKAGCKKWLDEARAADAEFKRMTGRPF